MTSIPQCDECYFYDPVKILCHAYDLPQPIKVSGECMIRQTKKDMDRFMRDMEKAMEEMVNHG